MNLKSSIYLNENEVRLTALQVCALSSKLAATLFKPLAFYITLDFLFRGFRLAPTPLSMLSSRLNTLMHLERKPIFGPPKFFSARIGALLSLLITLFLVTGMNIPAIFITFMLILFAFLEGVFRICAGCYIYNLLFTNRT